MNGAVDLFIQNSNLTWDEFHSQFLATPCEILKSNSENQEFQGNLDGLKQKVLLTNPNRDHFETIITVDKTGPTITYNVSVQAATMGPGTTSVTGTGSNFDIATMHNHPEKHIPIFSPGDMVSFYDKYKFVATQRKAVFTYYVTNANGTTYALRMEDISALEALLSGFNLDIKAEKLLADQKITKIFETYGKMDKTHTYTADEAERMFLTAMNSEKFGNGSSVSLYQQEGGDWKKLTQNPDGSIHKEPCP